LQSRLVELEVLDAEVLAISADSVEQNQRLAESAELEFSLLADPERKAIEAYGLLHAGASIDGGDIARPAMFLVDRNGSIAWRSLTDNWRVRVRPATVVQEVSKLP
jgi:peroxiredoxin Q/BCP